MAACPLTHGIPTCHPWATLPPPIPFVTNQFLTINCTNTTFTQLRTTKLDPAIFFDLVGAALPAGDYSTMFSVSAVLTANAVSNSFINCSFGNL